MGKGSSYGSPTRWLAGLALIAAMWLVAFEHDDRIPGLTYVNLGLHEFGHMLTYASSDLVNALAGSIAQVAIPLAVALWLFVRRGDWVAAGVCLMWAATSAIEVAIYAADAPKKELDLIGDQHDWAFILGPDGYDAIGKAASLAHTIREWASVAAVFGFLLCLAAPLKGRGRKPQPEGTAAPSRATAA
jgi:hypothetical protein